MTPFIDPQNLLHPDELAILQAADACPYEISYAKSLGDIHQQVPVYILTRKEESRQRKVVVTEAELKELQEQAKREQDELLRKMQDGTLTAEEQKNLDKNLHYYRQVLSARAGEHDAKIPETLGEFIDDEKGKRVYLYLYTIRNEVKFYTSAVWLLAQTYAHEMHHAAYHTRPSEGAVNTFVEEPMAELGMLQWAKAFEHKNSQHQGFHKSAISSVEWKKIYLPDYGFGEYIFRQGQIQPQMLVVAGKPLMNSQLIRTYSLPFRLNAYPWPHEEEYAELLWRILHNQSSGKISRSKACNPRKCNPVAIDEALTTGTWDSKIFTNPDITFCDPFYLSDDFVNIVERKLMDGLAAKIPDEKARRQHIREKQIFRRKDSSDIHVWLKDFWEFEAPDSTYYQNLLGQDSPLSYFNLAMGLPPFYEMIHNKQVDVWQNAVGNSLQVTRCGEFCVPADWYHYRNARDYTKQNFYDWLRERVERIYDYEDSQMILPQYPRLSKGACIIDLTRWGALSHDIGIQLSNGLSFAHQRLFDIIIRDEMSLKIIEKCSGWPMRDVMLNNAQSVGTYTIQLSRILKRVNGEFRMVKKTGIATKKNANTISIINPVNPYPPSNPDMLFQVPEPILDAFFESELATFIAMTYSGVTKYSVPTITKIALGYLPNIVGIINDYVRSNGAGILSQPWDDDAFYRLFGLTDAEIAHVRDRLKCN